MRIDLVITRHLKLTFPSVQTYELPGMIPVNKVELKGHWGYESGLLLTDIFLNGKNGTCLTISP